MPSRRGHPYAAMALLIATTLIVSFAAQVALADPDPSNNDDPQQKDAKGTGTQSDSAKEPDAGEPDTGETEVKGVLILEGQVTDYIGAGLRDVEVTVRRAGSKSEPGELVGTAKTDRLGDFQIRTPEPIHGDVVVTFVKESYTELTQTQHLGEDEYPPYLAETLEGNLTFSGTVTDALTKKPVEKAQVTVKTVYRDWEATTDKAGRFQVKGIVPTDGEVVVEAEGFGREQRNTVLTPNADDILIELKPERIAHVFVEDDSGRPVPGATLELYDGARNDFRAVVVDDKGRSTIRGLHFDADRISVRLTHPDYVSSIGFDREILPPRDKAESDHHFTMQRAGFIEGRVTDRETGKPLYGVRLMSGETNDDDSPRDWSDLEGKYRITGVKPGQAVVTAHMSGYAPDLAAIEVKSGETARLDLRLDSPRVLNGLVKNKNGDPVENANVEASEWRGFSTLGLRAITDGAGRFRIENAPSDEFEITVYSRFSEPSAQTVTAAPGRIVEVTIDEIERLDRPQAAVKVGMQAPAVAIMTLDGKSYELSSLNGKVVVLDFWATWCGPCVADMPRIKALHDKFGAHEQFALIGISLDWDKKSLEKFVNKYKIQWPQVFDNDNKDAKLADKFGVVGIPSLFLINSDGKIDAVDPRPEDLAKRIEQLLKGK